MLDGKTVLVIGATSGIGRAASALFAGQGASVIAAGRRVERGDAVEREAEAAGGSARFIRADLADDGSLDSLFATIRRDYPRLDAAFNNAGVQPTPGPLHEYSDEVFDQVFRTNVRGLFRCLKAELAIMKDQGGGAICNTSSIAGLRAFQANGIYTASKHAIVGLTKSAAIDSAQFGVRVNCICPGATESEMMQETVATRPGGLAATVAPIPMKRAGRPEEPAAAAAWLLSDMASFVTGVTVPVDGVSIIR
jgi:NAD(P)-dependent dehydrogenase (short-subunit alcohol dehydrogenase family)